nr:rod shape-determining protein MreD [Polynucleobacter rarus]
MSMTMTLLFAFMINMLPWGNHPWIPDFILPVLLYWVLFFPEKISLILFFLLGLMMDIQTSCPLGLHAMGYVVGSVVMFFWSRKLLTNSPLGQLLVVFQIFLLIHSIINIIFWLLVPSFFFSVSYILFPAVIELCLWPLVRKVLTHLGTFLARRKL